MKQISERMLTNREVAQLLHVHPNTVYRLGNRGELLFSRVSTRGDRRYWYQDVMGYLEATTRR